MIAILQALIGTVFLILISQFSFTLPTTPIPITLQTIGVFLVAGILGGRQATLSLLFYLIAATYGLPVLSGWKANPLWFLDMGGGYLIGFLIIAFLVGFFLEDKKNHRFFRLFLTLFLAHMILFLIGWGWMFYFLGAHQAFMLGVWPFIQPAAIKIVLSTIILKGFFFLKERRADETAKQQDFHA